MSVIEGAIRNKVARNPYLWVQHSAAQSIPNNAWTLLHFNTNRVDQDRLHDHTSGAEDSKFYFRPHGLYVATVQVSWAANGIGGRGLRFVQDGFTAASVNAPGLAAASLPAGEDQHMQCTMQPGVAVGTPPSPEKFWEIQVFQNSGAALNCTVVGLDTPSMMAGFICAP